MSAIGPSYSTDGMFQYQGLPSAAAQNPSTLAALLLGVCSDLGRIQAAPSPTQVRALLGAARVVGKQVGAGVDGGSWEDVQDLAGDIRPDDPRGPVMLASTQHAFAWDWVLSRLRWCLRSPALETIQSLEGADRDAFVDALRRVEVQVASVASTRGVCS